MPGGGLRVEVFEALVPELVFEDEMLRFEAVTDVEILGVVRGFLLGGGFDEHLIMGAAPWRAFMRVDPATGRIEGARASRSIRSEMLIRSGGEIPSEPYG